jgi:hypothetical protein
VGKLCRMETAFLLISCMSALKALTRRTRDDWCLLNLTVTTGNCYKLKTFPWQCQYRPTDRLKVTGGDNLCLNPSHDKHLPWREVETMPSTRALFTGLTILASNIGIISATKFTIGPGDVGGCIVTVEDACGCNDWAYIHPGGDCPTASGDDKAKICDGTVEINWESPYYEVSYFANNGNCLVGCDLRSREDGSSCS